MSSLQPHRQITTPIIFIHRLSMPMAFIDQRQHYLRIEAISRQQPDHGISSQVWLWLAASRKINFILTYLFILSAEAPIESSGYRSVFSPSTLIALVAFHLLFRLMKNFPLCWLKMLVWKNCPTQTQSCKYVHRFSKVHISRCNVLQNCTKFLKVTSKTELTSAYSLHHIC